MTGGAREWTGERHTGKIILPDGNRLPAQVASFAAPAPEGAFFVMAAPSIWRSAGVQSEELGLEQLMTAVLLHEAVHVLQFPTYGSQMTRLTAMNSLPEEFNDDSIQEQFETEGEFAASVEREIGLLLAAAAAVERDEAERLAGEARSLAKTRQVRFFSGELAYLKEAEDLWLTLEGSGQWLGYRWLTERRGGDRSPALAAQGFGLRGKWWSQRHGFALFAALERLAGSEWRREAFGKGTTSAGEMLDRVLRKPED